MSIKLTKKEVRDIVYGDSEKYFLIDSFIDEVSWWRIHKAGIIKCYNDDKCYMIYWNETPAEKQKNEFWSQTVSRL